MSSRQLRRLQKQRELEEASVNPIAESDQAEDSEDDQPAPTTRPKPNLFAALGGGDDDDDADAEPDDDDEGGAVVAPAVSETKPSASAKKSKKKKKKAKKKAAAVDTEAAAGSEEDEIDKAIKALKIANTGKGTPAQDEEQERRAMASNDIFQINTYHLRAVNEMRNLFGREVIESAEAEEERQQQEQQQQRLRGRGVGTQGLQMDLETFLRAQPPNAKKLPEVSLRRNVFVQGRDHWPAESAGGLTMKEVAAAATTTEYAYLHEGGYDGLQTLFFACVQLGDPMRMVHLLKRAPYHVSTLLQVSAVARQDQNMALSAELCERALFAFGRVSTSAFRRDLERGRARLDFRRPENRQLWLAGYHYLRSLLRKGTYRTALEWARLLYALDPSGDPYAMRHYLHFLAVRAHESAWLLEFLQDVEGNADAHEDFVYVRQSAVLARLQMGEKETARKELEAGMRRVPWLYCALFQELGLDAPPSIWGIHAASDARQFWVKLYLHFAKDLWNNTQATGLLVEVAKSIDKVRVADLPVDDSPPGLDATRLVYLEGQTGLITLAPRTLLDRQPNYDFDPIPPAEEDNVFTYLGTELPWAERRQRPVGSGADAVDVQETLERMRNNLIAQGGGGGGGGRPVQAFGVAGQIEDESEYEAETDEELRRDLEEHARRSRAPGYLNQLMQLMGIGGGREPAAAQSGEDGVEEQDDEVPGAWPGADQAR